MPSFLIAFLVSSTILLGLVAGYGEARHPFIIPVFACGVLIGTDAVDWVRGRLGLFDPAGLIGLLGYHTYFICPILIACWNHRLRYLPDQPNDYRPWLGVLAVFVFVGLTGYRIVRYLLNRTGGRSTRAPMRLHPQRFSVILISALCISAALQVWIYQTFGGFSGYIGAYSAWLHGQDTFQGSAPLFAVSESFPILFIIGFAVWCWGAPWRRRWSVISLVLILFLGLEIVFGGLRGSRSNIVWGFFWASGIVHLYVRRISTSVVIASIPVLVVFLAGYSVFKMKGDEMFEFLAKTSSYEDIENGTVRFDEVLLADLGRSDVQAFLLYRMLQYPDSYQYAFGRTYLGAVSLLVPKSIWPNRPPAKVRWTTDAEFGEGSYAEGQLISTRVYGLAGEAVLNFGPFGIPAAFILFGVLIGSLQRLTSRLTLGDSRRLLLPCLSNLCLIVLLNDSDNQIFFICKYTLFPASIVFFSSGRCFAQSAVMRTNYARPVISTRLPGASAL